MKLSAKSLRRVTGRDLLTVGVLVACLFGFVAVARSVGAAPCPVGPGAYDVGCNFNHRNLKAVNATGANFTDASFVGANFTNARLTRANFNGANLTSATLTGATVAGAAFGHHVVFTNVTTGSLLGRPASLPPGWMLVRGFLVGPGANLTGATLNAVNLSGANLTGANLTSANLTGANLHNAILTNANLATTNLHNANLSGANLTGAKLLSTNLNGITSGGIVGTPASLRANWSLVAGYLVGPGADLEGAHLYNSNLTKVDLNGADLTGASLHDSNLTSAILTGATLAGANLHNAILTLADLDDVSSGGIFSTPAALPTNWALVDGYLIGPGADLAGANLSASTSRA